MLVLKRGYQFWYTLLALHRVGAIAIPATHLLTAKDYVYRANAATVKMMIITGDGDPTDHVNEAMPECTTRGDLLRDQAQGRGREMARLRRAGRAGEPRSSRAPRAKRRTSPPTPC